MLDSESIKRWYNGTPMQKHSAHKDGDLVELRITSYVRRHWTAKAATWIVDLWRKQPIAVITVLLAVITLALRLLGYV